MCFINNCRKAAILFICLFCVAGAYAQKNFEYQWKPAEPHTELDESMKKLDAVMIFTKRYILNDVASLNYIYREEIHNKIKILTPKGLMENTTVYVAKNSNASFKGIDARTIKPDGRVIDLKSDEIKRVDFRGKDEEDNSTEFRFSIPGVEVGDEVEYFISYESWAIPRGRDLLLQSRLVTLEADLILKVNKDFRFDMVTYNGMRVGTHTEEQYYNVYKWTMYDLQSTLGQNKSCPKAELPYVSYMIRSKASNTMYDGLYRFYNEVYEDKNYEGRDFNKLLWSIPGVKETPDAYGQFRTIYSYIMANVKLVGELPKEEQDKSIGYFLQKKMIDHKRLHILLRHVMDECRVKYYIAVGRGRYDGHLDFNFIPPQAVTDFFFSIEDEARVSHIIYPGYHTYYQVDEIPSYLKGTEVLLIGKPAADGSFPNVKAVGLPMNPIEANVRSRVCRMTIDMASDSVRYKYKETLSGDLSTRFNEADEEEREELEKIKGHIVEELEVEREDTQYPFTRVIRYYMKQPNIAHPIGSNSCSITLGDLFDVHPSPVNDGRRTLTYYSLFVFNDMDKVILSFDREIATDNLDKLIHSVENDNAGVKLTAVRMDPKTISIEAQYEMKKEYIDAGEIETLRSVNKALKELCQSKLVVVFK